jgi:hypothetical protein
VLPKKTGHSGKFWRNVFQDAQKKIGSLRIFFCPIILGRLYRLKKIIFGQNFGNPNNLDA